jgi:hypothetical protein
MVLHDLGMAGRGDAGGLVDVLEADRDAVQRSAIFAGGDLGLGGTRLMARRIGEYSDETVQPASSRAMRSSRLSTNSTGDNSRFSINRAASAIVR